MVSWAGNGNDIPSLRFLGPSVTTTITNADGGVRMDWVPYTRSGSLAYTLHSSNQQIELDNNTLYMITLRNRVLIPDADLGGDYMVGFDASWGGESNTDSQHYPHPLSSLWQEIPYGPILVNRPDTGWLSLDINYTGPNNLTVPARGLDLGIMKVASTFEYL